MLKPNNLSFRTSQQNPKAHYEQGPSRSNSGSVLSRIRRLQNKRVLNDTDLRDLSDIIQKQHISIFGSLNHFFIKLRSQLLLSYHFYIEMKTSNPHLKDKDKSFSLIPFSKYFHPSIGFRCIVFVQLYDSFHQKFVYYNKNPISQFYLNQKTTNILAKQQLEKFNEDTLKQIYPAAYALYDTLKNLFNEFDDYQLAYKELQKSQSKTNKQAIVYSVINQQHSFQTQSNVSLQKPSKIIGRFNKLEDHQFYEIESFIDKTKLQCKLLNTQSPLLKHVKTQPKSVPIKCIGCASIMYWGEPIQRDRSSMSNFEVVKSVKDSKSYPQLKQLIEGFMNSPNGGVILFDCDDFLFQVYPRGFEATLKDFEYRRQSIIDRCKNYFKDLQIDRDFSIDFVLLHDKNKNPIIKTTQNETKEFFITRLKIFGRKITSELKTNDEVESKKMLGDSKIIGYEVENNNLGPIDYEEMKMRFYRNEEILKKIDKPQVYKKIEKAFYNNKIKMGQILRGRVTPIHLHENYGCRTSQMVSINIPASQKAESKSSPIKK